ncbi:MAG: LacI family DNA-binding transcriptional regulator [Acidobacteriaceae bacterium]|nr:LacI family DNA-binding transcriptional regulator [Acidobacteriaceae bacterium]
MTFHKTSRAPTITDVAEVLHISRATVSRAFSRPDLLSEQTVKSVHAAAAKLGYRPNQTARALSTGRHGNIAIVVPDIANPFFPPLIRAAQIAADGGGFSLFLADSDEDAAREHTLLEKLLLQADGFVVVSSRMADEQLQQLAKRHPMVLVNRDTPGIPRVLIDTTQGIEEAVTHLAGLGHKRLVYVGGPAASWSHQQRRLAVKQATTRQKIALEQVSAERPTFEAGKVLAPAVLKTKATAAITFDDFVAHGLMAGLTDASVQVPQDFSVIGCDDVLGASTYPALTSVSARCIEAGRMAVEMLLQILQTGKSSDQRCILDTRLVIRATTASSPAK